jgi:serine/threonine protein kinase
LDTLSAGKVGQLHFFLIVGANILCDAKGNIKLADSGLAKEHVESRPNLSDVGTPYCKAPEIRNGKPHSFPADIWYVTT